MEDTVISVHVVFRHGDRTPEKKHLYPKDPHIDVDYLPYGHGNITNKGKRRSYELGKVLRKRYDNLLGDVYKSEYLDAWTTDYERTKMTLQLVLASLYPPKNEQRWHESLDWQPIPYKYVAIKQDKYLASALFNPDSQIEYRNYVKTHGVHIMEKYRDVIKFVEENTGLSVSSPRNLLLLAGTLITEEEMGLTLPEWTKNVWPNPIVEIALLEYEFVVASTRLKAFAIGSILQKIVNDTQLKIDGQSDCKMHIYSGHDFNVALIVNCIGGFISRPPNYCANVVLELHKIDGIYGFKSYYQKNVDEEPELLKFPNGDEFCTFEKFIDMFKDILKETKSISSL